MPWKKRMSGLLGSTETPGEKLAIAFFGIRGVGSFYYLAYALNHGQFNGETPLWAIVSLVVVSSILLHGLTVTPAMRSLDRRHGRDPDVGDIPPPGLQGPASQRLSPARSHEPGRRSPDRR